MKKIENLKMRTFGVKDYGEVPTVYSGALHKSGKLGEKRTCKYAK